MSSKDAEKDEFMRKATATLALRRARAPRVRSMNDLKASHYARGTVAPAVEFGSALSLWDYFRNPSNAESMIRPAGFFDIVIIESRAPSYHNTPYIGVIIPRGDDDLIRLLFRSSSNTVKFFGSSNVSDAVAMSLSHADSRAFLKGLK